MEVCEGRDFISLPHSFIHSVSSCDRTYKAGNVLFRIWL